MRQIETSVSWETVHRRNRRSTFHVRRDRHRETCQHSTYEPNHNTSSVKTGLKILEAALHLGAHVLMVAQVLLDDVPAGRGKQAGLLELCQFLVRQLQPDGRILIVVTLKTDGVPRGIVDGDTVQGQRHQFMFRQVVDRLHAFVHLVVLSLAIAVLRAHEAGKCVFELYTGHGEPGDGVVVREQRQVVAQGNDGPQLRLADTAAADKGDIDPRCFLDRVGEQVPQFCLARALWVRERACELRNDAAVLFVDDVLEPVDERGELFVGLAVDVVDWDQFPGPVDDAVGVVVHGDVESSDLVGTDPGLRDQDVLDDGGLLQYRVAMPSDDHVDTPGRIQQARKLLVVLKADVGQQDRQVDIIILVVVAYFPDFGCCLLQCDKRRQYVVGFQHVHDLLRDDPDEQDVEAVDVLHHIRLEQALVVLGDVEVGVDDGEIGNLLQEQEVWQSIIELVVAQRGDVRRQVVHDLDRADPLVLGVDD